MGLDYMVSRIKDMNSPLETVKSGAIDIVDAVKDGLITANEAAEAIQNFVKNKVGELKDLIGEPLERINNISGELFDRLLLPIIGKIQDWIKFIFESILRGSNVLLSSISRGFFSESKSLYKRMIKIALGEEEFDEFPKEFFNQWLGLLRLNIDEAAKLEEMEPFKTILPLFATLKDLLEIVETLVKSPKGLQELVNEYIRPIIVNYVKEKIPFEKIPIQNIDKLRFEEIVNNIFGICQLFKDSEANISSLLESIVELLVKSEMNDLASLKLESGPDIPEWSWEILNTILTMEGLIIGSLTLYPTFQEAATGKRGQFGTALAIVGVWLGYFNIINATADYISGGKFDQTTAEYLNGIKASKDLALLNSTAMIITTTGMVLQLKGGASPYEYIATMLGFLMGLGGLVCSIGSGSIQSDPMVGALQEVYLEMGQDLDIVGGAKERLLPADPYIEGLYATYNNPPKMAASPIIRVEKPWYGPEIINFCFVDREYGRKVAEDFIDETGIKGMWLSARVRNDGLVSARVHVSFFYNLDDGPLQSLHDATIDQQLGDLLNPGEIRDYWFQNWNFSRSEAADVCRSRYRIIAAVALEGKYDSQKSLLRNSTKIQIPPYFQFNPISLSSEQMMRSKSTDQGEIPLIQEGDILTLSTRIKNMGGKFAYMRKIIVRWYVDDGERNYIMIAKEPYNLKEGIDLNYGDEIPIALIIDTKNLGFCPYTTKGWIRDFKIALLKGDFDDYFGENMPLFSDGQETELTVAFDTSPPELQNPKVTLSNSSPTEGQTIISTCKFKNTGKIPVNLRDGTLKIEELAADRSAVLKTHYPKIELHNSNFDLLPFDGGYSSEGTTCEMISFEFSPTANICIDSIQIKAKPGTPDNILCSNVQIIYAGFTIARLEECDETTGIHYLNDPILLEEGKLYFFRFEGIRGIPMIEAKNFRVGSREIIRNGVITINSNQYLYAHPKIKLSCLRTLPAGGESLIEFDWDTAGKNTTKFLSWNFNSTNQNIEIAETLSVNVRVGKIRGFQILCENPVGVLDRTRILEFPIKITKEEDVQSAQVKVSVIAPKANEKKFKVYLVEDPERSSNAIKELNLNLQDSIAREFIAVIKVAPQIKVAVGFSSAFMVKAVAKVQGQKIEKLVQLQFMVNSDLEEYSRKDYEFIFRPDIVLALPPGIESTLSIMVENTGSKADTISLFMSRSIPLGGYLRPYKMNVSLNPDEVTTVQTNIYVPPSASIGIGGKITIKAVSKGNPALIQTKDIIIRIIGDESERSELRKALF